MKITLQFICVPDICRYLFHMHLWHVIEQAHEIQKLPKVESKDANVILKICQFIKSEHHLMVKTYYLHDYFLLLWFSTGGNFASQGVFVSVWKHFWLSQLNWGGGGRAASI